MNCAINFPVAATVPINASSTPNFLTTTPSVTNVPVGHMKKKFRINRDKLYNADETIGACILCNQ